MNPDFSSELLSYFSFLAETNSGKDKMDAKVDYVAEKKQLRQAKKAAQKSEASLVGGSSTALAEGLAEEAAHTMSSLAPLDGVQHDDLSR